MPVTAHDGRKPRSDEQAPKVETPWNAAADSYTNPALSFGDYFGLRIIERLALRPGAQVLDVCCGAGAVAIPAAAAVGRRGRVVGVDIADRLLNEGKRRAAEAHLENITWRIGDLAELPFCPASFDAVVCAFGIYYASDMRATTRRLWALVRPGGKLLIATWAERLFEPANAAFWNALKKVQPSLFCPANPWDSIAGSEAFADMLLTAGIPGGSVSEEPYEHPLLRPEDWWTIMQGSHYRAVIDALTPPARERVAALTLRPLMEERIEWINASALFALARK
jgi:ubiquinone/menaquinone biosynthesis C-methylase UbiE